QYLKARAVAREPRLDDRLGPLDTPIQMARVPRDLVGRMALEVRRVEVAPERALGVAGHRVQPQQALRLRLPRLDAVLNRLERAVAGQLRARRVKQVLEQLGLPCVPNLWTGAANVGDGEQIERDQPALAADLARERRDNV